MLIYKKYINKIKKYKETAFFFIAIFLIILVKNYFNEYVVKNSNSGILTLLIDLLTFVIFYLSLNQLSKIIPKKNNLDLVVLLFYTNLGLTIISFIGSLLKNEIIFNTIYFFFNIIVISVNFIILKKLYYSKQKKNISFYFNLMFGLMIATAILHTVVENISILNFSLIIKFFEIITFLLTFYCATKFAWITFLYKKEKLFLILMSVLIVAVLFVNRYFLMQDILQKNIFFNNLQEYNTGFVVLYFILVLFSTLFTLPSADFIEEKKRELNTIIKFSKLTEFVLTENKLFENIANIFSEFFSIKGCWILKFKEDDYDIVAIENVSYTFATKISDVLKLSIKNEKSFKNLKISEQLLSEEKKKIEQVNVMPLLNGDEPVAYLCYLTDTLYYDEEDYAVLKAFQDYINMMLKNSKLVYESIEKERLKNELELAAKVQKRLLPEKDPSHDYFEILSYYKPAYEVGGDYYDYFRHDEKKFSFLISDVSGKGLTASFIMSEIKGIFTVLSEIYNDPKTILKKANSLLKKILSRTSYITGIYATVDIQKNELTYCRAGHLPLLLKREDKVIKLNAKGIGLGLVFDDFENYIDTEKIELHNDDIFIMYTDGVTEAMNSEGELFGLQRLINLVQNSKDLKDIYENILKEIKEFSSENQNDDITFILFKYKNRGENDRI
ncbi:MAG TPA: SpoIIE family protein phosphatase [Ignavibacteriales bacterium]|nr:SpoIIE family protein phosphatase [Ignavibacteriales bacterium]